MKKPVFQQRLLTVEEVAKELGVSRARVAKLLATGELPSLVVGRRRRVPIHTLGRWIHERMPARKSEDSEK